MAGQYWDAAKLTPEKRLEIARVKLSRIVEHVIGLIGLHESNQVTIYTDVLSKQIPRSFAAHAFNLFQRTTHHFELIRLCALWDRPKQDRESIPTVCMLIDEPRVLDLIGRDIASQWANMGIEATEDAAFAEQILASERRFGEEQAARILLRVKEAIDTAQAVERSDSLASLVNFRDKHLAHSLAETTREKRGEVLPLPRYGDEREILDKSISIVQAFYLGACNADFDFKGTRVISRKNADALWSGCSISVKR